MWVADDASDHIPAFLVFFGERFARLSSQSGVCTPLKGVSFTLWYRKKLTEVYAVQKKPVSKGSTERRIVRRCTDSGVDDWIVRLKLLTYWNIFFILTRADNCTSHRAVHVLLYVRLLFVFTAVIFPSPLLDNIWVMVIVWRLRGNIVRTVVCWIVWHNVHSQLHTYVSSSYRSNRLDLSHWDPCAVRRGGCLELTYYVSSGTLNPTHSLTVVMMVSLCLGLTLSICLSVCPSVCP